MVARTLALQRYPAATFVQEHVVAVTVTMLKVYFLSHTRNALDHADADLAHVTICVKRLATEKTAVLASLPAKSAAGILNAPCAAMSHVHHALRDAHGNANIVDNAPCKSSIRSSRPFQVNSTDTDFYSLLGRVLRLVTGYPVISAARGIFLVVINVQVYVAKNALPTTVTPVAPSQMPELIFSK